MLPNSLLKNIEIITKLGSCCWFFFFFFGSMRELIVLYIREEIQSSNKPSLSAEGFLSFTIRKKSNPSYIYLCSQITICAFAIIKFRMTLHWNNIKLAQSGDVLRDVFYGRNHPFYELIEFHFLVQIFTIQDEVKPFYEKYFTVSLSRDSSKGEEWDFHLENINKLTQGWIPKNGVLTETMWTNACRNVDQL